MRLFCRENHEAEIHLPRNYKQELLEAKAYLARVKKKPESAFPEKTHGVPNLSPYGSGFITKFNKADTIANAEAEVAELEVLTEELKDK